MWTFQMGLLFDGNGSVILMGAYFIFEFLFLSGELQSGARARINEKHSLTGQVIFKTHHIRSKFCSPILSHHCHFVVAKSYLTLCNPMDCSPPGSSVLGILQARILEWVAMPSSRGSSWLRDGTQVSCTRGQILYHWATGKPISYQATPLNLNLIKLLYFLHFHTHTTPFAWNVLSFFSNWPNSLCFSCTHLQEKLPFLPHSKKQLAFSQLQWIPTCKAVQTRRKYSWKKPQPQQKPKEQINKQKLTVNS